MPLAPCTDGCKGHTQELSEALYKKHAKFRELDKATHKGNMDDLASPWQANIQYSESVLQTLLFFLINMPLPNLFHLTYQTSNCLQEYLNLQTHVSYVFALLQTCICFMFT
jgi:hypothetical protein